MSNTLSNWVCSTFSLAMIGGVLLWAALPPLDLAPLAWIAPVFWVLLIRAEKLQCFPHTESAGYVGNRWLLLLSTAALFTLEMSVTDWFHARKFQGYAAAEVVFWPALFALVCWAAWRWRGHPYRCLWLAGMFFWLADLHWLRFPYWAISFGWLALGIYFGLYLPVFVGLSRIGVHRLRLPVILVAPAVWTGLELAQAHLLSGMTMGCLEHSQYRWTELIQISDLTGTYGVTFLMMLVAACIARMLPAAFGRAAWGEVGLSRASANRREARFGPEGEGDARRWAIWPIVPAAALLAAALLYGHWRTARDDTAPGLKIALVQGCFDVQLPSPEGFGQVMDIGYRQLTKQSLSLHTDLIVWPETVFCCIDPASGDCVHFLTNDADAAAPSDYPITASRSFREVLASWEKFTRDEMTRTSADFGRPMIVGVDREHYSARGRQIFNTAVLITPDGRWCDQPPDRYFYDKTHLVPFGEYMPFADLVPWLQYISPLGNGSSSSDRPACFQVKGICLAPNICYESTLPHVIRNQLVALRQQGIEPQILVNLTNDGWFWGSSELEMHLACGVFRAVETRRPMVIAANTGISAWIDGNGEIKDRGPTHGECTIDADVRLDNRESWYLRHGDWFAGACLAATIALAAAGILPHIRSWLPCRKAQ